MSLGLMQPYLFPYLGYFQLMNCVDTYVFYENVQYIKNGWVNRNRIFVNVKKNQTHYFTFSVAKEHYKKNIDQRHYSNLKEDCNKLKRNLFQSYRDALNFEEAYELIEDILDFQNDNVAYFNMNANHKIAEYLGVTTKITCMETVKDAAFWEKFTQLNHEDKVIHICKYFKENSYINAINGMSLYHRDFFAAKGIDLKFIKMKEVEYSQFSKQFVPCLSILDVIMHNKLQDSKEMLERYQLI